MIIRVGEQDVPVTFVEGEPASSSHTNKTLRTGAISFQISSPWLQEAVLNEIQSAREPGHPILAVNDSAETRFTVEESSYSVRGDVSSWRHEIRVREWENLRAAELLISGLRLEPYEYEEHVDDGAITISCKVQTDDQVGGQLVERIRKSRGGDYFEVVRRGLEDAPRTMRFGHCQWSSDGHNFKYDFVLVEKAIDDRPERLPRLFDPELGNTVRGTARTSTLVDLLIGELISRGYLSQEQSQTMRKRAQDEDWDQLWALYRTKDIDR
jgi:hypothetical protein